MLAALNKIFSSLSSFDRSSPIGSKDGCPPKLYEIARQKVIEVMKNKLPTFKPEKLQFIDAKRVTWENGALGCPKPGYNYTQALEQGYKIAFNYLGKPIAAHTGNHHRIVICVCNSPVIK